MKAADQGCLMGVREGLSEMHIALKKAQVLLNSLSANYFAYDKKAHEDDRGMKLLYGYEEAQTFIGLADDCVHAAMQCVYKVMDDVDQEREGADDSTGQLQ